MARKHVSRRDSGELDVRAHELRRNLTGPERRLWSLLRRRQLDGVKFRRQQIVGPFIVDFYCASERLVIEVDGETHVGRGVPDAARVAFLEQAGLRVTNDDVLRDPESVMRAIMHAIGREA